MSVKHYDVYDTQKNFACILESVSRSEMANYLKTDIPCHISTYAEKGHMLFGRYRVFYHDDFIDRWNEAVELLRHVQWVKSDGKKLTVNGGGTDERIH